MKGKDLLILGGVGLAAYFLFFNKKAAVKEALPDMPQIPFPSLPTVIPLIPFIPSIPEIVNDISRVVEGIPKGLEVIPKAVESNFKSILFLEAGSVFNKKNVIVPAAPTPQYSSIVLNPKTLTFQSPLTTNKLFGTVTNPLFNRK